MVKKDRSTIVNKTDLIKMINPLYQKHLEHQLSQAQLLFLSVIIEVLQNLKQVKAELIATALPLPILFESRRKKLQRLLSLKALNMKRIWFPILQDWLATTFRDSDPLYIALDRTNWDDLNLLMVSLIYRNRAIPLYGEFLNKLGSSNLSEQIRVLSPVLGLLKSDRVVVLGDREFCSVLLGNWLEEQGVGYVLRLKETTSFQKNGKFESLNQQGLKAGTSFFFKRVKVTQQVKSKTFNVAGKWKRTYQQTSVSEGWYLLTNLESQNEAVAAYKRRFDIEEMFRDFKSGGYNLEDSQVRGERLNSLMLLLFMAYFQATMTGQKFKQKNLQKYLGRPEEKQRNTRRHSSFYLGLYCRNWIPFWHQCWSTVEKLMKLSPNKLPYYQRGMRAMKLILSTF